MRLALLITLALAACSSKTERPAASADAAVAAPDEAAARKARSEAALRGQGVPINAALPAIASGAEARIRGQGEVVERALALVVVAVKGEGLEQLEVLRLRDELGAAAYLSPEEAAFVADQSPTPAERARFAWRYECLGVLLWALGFDAVLGRPDQIVDAGRVVAAVLKRGAETFRAEARLRSPAELLDQADLTYRYDWACVDARVHGEAPPPGVDCEIVLERHHALNWLIGHGGQAWDDVKTDT